MIGFIADYEFVWGFQARIVGLSKTSPSFLYPPPTTFLGALAEVIAKENSFGEERGMEMVSEISKKLCAIGFRALNCVPLKYSDINRILAVKITGGKLYPNPEDLGKSFDSPARGKTILSSLKERKENELIVRAPTIRWFLVFKEPFINLNGKRIEVGEDLFWKIHRIGSKESRVSAVNVEKVEVEMKEGVVSTTFSFPVDQGIEERVRLRRWEFEVYINPYVSEHRDPISSYFSGKKALPFRVPIVEDPLAPPEFKVKVGGDYVAYSAGDETVIGCRR